MKKSDEEFYKELLNDFKEEAGEHLQNVVNALLELEKIDSADHPEQVEMLFRETHSLKGAARAVDLKNIENLCMAMEDVMHKLKNKELQVNRNFFDVFFEATDMLEVLISEIGGTKQTITENQLSKTVSKLQAIEKGRSLSGGKEKKKITSAKPDSKTDTGETPPEKSDRSSQQNTHSDRAEAEPTDAQDAESEPQAETQSAASATAAASQSETIRVATKKLNDILFLAEEMITSKAVLSYQVQQVETLTKEFAETRRLVTEALMQNDFTEQQTDSNTRIAEDFQKMESDLTRTTRQIEELRRSTSRHIDDLNFMVKKTMMQPFSVLLSVIPRIVRDLSKEHDKKIEMSMEGEHIEIDRRILEQMKDPLIHLIRNAIDHGIESAAERRKNNKNEQGALTIKVFRESGQKIGIYLQDDGKGLNHNKLVEAALKNQVIKPGEESDLTPEQINQLIFSSGLSTSPIITDVSGRGLGMAIVAEKINRLGGKIAVQSQQGRGTTFSIELPQTLATFKGILVEVSGQQFLFPTPAVNKALKVRKADIKTVESKSILRLENETVSLLSLAGVLGLKQKAKSAKEGELQVLIIQNKAKIGFSIDKVLGEYESTVKPLGKQLKNVRNIEGACLMGDGSVVPVLQVDELIQAAETARENIAAEEALKPAQKAQEQTKKVLIAEDSITVRNMEKSFVEAAGYEVSTAVDGQAAFDQLQKENFDIVVSDIEMPRMNGFELTSKIRQDRKLEHLPVILVTALEAKADRDRGLEAGANAYIVKSSFEKSNLMDTINRLI